MSIPRFMFGKRNLWSNPLKIKGSLPYQTLRNYSKKSKESPSFSMTVPEATKYLRALSVSVPFDGSYVLSVGLRTRRGLPPVRGKVLFPHPFLEAPKLCVFAVGDAEREALQHGATYAGGENLVQKVLAGEIEFSKCLAHPNAAHLLPQVAKILGPKHLLPTTKRGTIVEEVGPAVEAAMKMTDYRETNGVINVPVGKLNYDDKLLQDNVEALLNSIRSHISKLSTKVKVSIKNTHLFASNTISLPLPYK
ncbi:ribosomal protein subunit L1 [Schizosaccharomyces cryophilus OY26]|uniref:Ribosomal protein subunit L1 n=1 Tax=Schizosaccharomyces cryophilus (strain OY26 / ATCC MYA-4695 / CBS 11777 / NBRC 106824 / NRRL Y48691) TaxID=653667 RepID=S9W4I5_SCHCR|nr:ribosomal protein subunit L1 [Schizosaccharomyces cryophilus OY26]EPY53429.1 ribosomal protein subunit L1 [Schizosaccharomyces cryophilus OY26]